MTISFTNDRGFEEKNPRFFVDINNDGKADIVGFSNSNIGAILSKGNSLDTDSFNLLRNELVRNFNYPTFDLFPRFLGDINNDGIIDVIAFYTDNV